MAETRDLSTAALAYLGDCVIELLVRERLVSAGLSHSASLNRAALAFVRAEAQSVAVERLLPHLTEAENVVYRRGRNAQRLNFPRNVKPVAYRRATGMETLFGYLHAAGMDDRVRELFDIAYAEELRQFEQKAEELNP